MLDRRSSDREVQRLGFRIEPDTFAFVPAVDGAPPPATGSEGFAVRRLVLGSETVTIVPAAPAFDADLDPDRDDALADAGLEALRDDGVLALSRLAAFGADAFGPF